MLEPPNPATWHIALPRGSTAVPIARAMVRTALQDLGVTTDRATAQLLTAELVTNALKHTCGTEPIELVVELQSPGCLIEVHDNDPMLIEGLLDDPLPLSGLGDAVLVAVQDGSGPARAAEGHGTADGALAADDVPAADGTRTADDVPAADGRRAADDRLPAQRTGGAGRTEDAGRSAGDEGSGGAGERAETGGTEAGTDTRATAIPITDTADTAEATEATEAAEAAEANGEDPHGCGGHRRGLLLLRSLSSEAGCRPTPHGKAVWFTLPEMPRRRRQ